MGQAYYCSRCKELLDEENITLGTIERLWAEDVHLSLCLECKTQLDDFIHGEKD